ncbi:MAG: tRNA uridine-5-carboxymethylaminomethyl(34) synthesis GTPase MnmE [Bacillota bacterium]|nr:tRNA uridine-5-carboxymethylaminomethyl(34) synthesis GTPase MnmE [Bacillota bacterium]
MYSSDTIAAISTPQGTGGIGIIRISGSGAFEIAEQLFKGRKPFKEYKPNSINHGCLINPANSEIIDDVLVSKMKAPNTFTREDIVEINCHGGMTVLKKVLELVVKSGARPAEAGEFTKRAFLNGRIDLSQAEAVIDLINSKTEEGSKAAVSQLEGKLSKRLKSVRDKLLDLISHIEVTVDYPEHDIEEITGQEVYAAIKEIRNDLERLTEGYDKGRILREGLNAVIIGKPNVGKSSLLNELSGVNKAIVTDIPGTTRDIIEEFINIGGIPVRIIDTAGIRETSDLVEKIGVQRAEIEIDNADIVLMMIDASEVITAADREILKKVDAKKAIIILNKTDISDIERINQIKTSLQGKIIIEMSIKEGTGLDRLETEIKNLFVKGDIKANQEILLTNVRHKVLIDSAVVSISEAVNAYQSGLPLDCITIDIRNSADYLGQITGESVSEDVMHRIFSRFCIGK